MVTRRVRMVAAALGVAATMSTIGVGEAGAWGRSPGNPASASMSGPVMTVAVVNKLNSPIACLYSVYDMKYVDRLQAAVRAKNTAYWEFRIGHTRDGEVFDVYANERIPADTRGDGSLTVRPGSLRTSHWSAPPFTRASEYAVHVTCETTRTMTVKGDTRPYDQVDQLLTVNSRSGFGSLGGGVGS